MKKRESKRKPPISSDRGGVQSVIVAARILKALASGGGPLPLKDVAAMVEMPRAKVHRYLTSLRRADLVGQIADGGRYKIGATAIAIGLTGLRGINPVGEVCAALPALSERTGQSATVAIWSEIGPVVIAMQESDHWLTMNIRIGSSLPLLTTAIGRTFLAHLPEQITSPLVEAEIRKARAAGTKFETEIDGLLNEIRMQGLARAPSALIPGVDAIAAPVFDYRDQLVAVMCVVARAQANITGWEGTAVRALTATTRDLSARLGHVAGEAETRPPFSAKAATKGQGSLNIVAI